MESFLDCDRGDNLGRIMREEDKRMNYFLVGICKSGWGMLDSFLQETFETIVFYLADDDCHDSPLLKPIA